MPATRFIDHNLARGWSQFFALHGARVVGGRDIIRCEPEGMSHAGCLGMGVQSESRDRPSSVINCVEWGCVIPVYQYLSCHVLAANFQHNYSL